MLKILIILLTIIIVNSCYHVDPHIQEIKDYCYTQASQKYPIHKETVFDCYRADSRKPWRVKPTEYTPAENLSTSYECLQLLPISVYADDHSHERDAYEHQCLENFLDNNNGINKK